MPEEITLDPQWGKVQEKYELLELIGKGTFGEIVKAMCKQSGEIVAIKYMHSGFHSPITIQKMIREVTILKQLSAMPNNRHTIKLLDIIAPPSF